MNLGPPTLHQGHGAHSDKRGTIPRVLPVSKRGAESYEETFGYQVVSSSLHSHVTLEWCDAISSLLLPRKSGIIKSLQLIITLGLQLIIKFEVIVNSSKLVILFYNSSSTNFQILHLIINTSSNSTSHLQTILTFYD